MVATKNGSGVTLYPIMPSQIEQKTKIANNAKDQALQDGLEFRSWTERV